MPSVVKFEGGKLHGREVPWLGTTYVYHAGEVYRTLWTPRFFLPFGYRHVGSIREISEKDLLPGHASTPN